MNCSPIFLVYLAFLLALLFFKDGRIKAIVIYVTFIFFFEASSFGTDYYVYRWYYVTDNYSWRHMELLYVRFAQYCSYSGMSFEVFRFVWGSVWVGLICYCAYKMVGKHFNLAFIVLYLGYPMYTLSAIRQIASMAIGFWCVYRMFYKHDFIIPIIAAYVSALFHQGGYLYLIFCIVCAVAALIGCIYSKIRHNKNPFTASSRLFTKFCRYGWLIFLLLCVVGRYVSFRLSYVPAIEEIVANIIGDDYYSHILYSFGMLSRGVLLALSMWAYAHIDKKSDVGPIVLFYVVCMACYLVLPFDTFAGRLFNNVRIFDVVIIPVIYSRLRSYERSERRLLHAYGESYVLPVSKVYVVLALAVYFAMFYQQMRTVAGYTDYTNIFPFLRFS